MNADSIDAEEELARLSQEATNQSPPDKSLTDRKARRSRKMKVATKRTKPPAAD